MLTAGLLATIVECFGCERRYALLRGADLVDGNELPSDLCAVWHRIQYFAEGHHSDDDDDTLPMCDEKMRTRMRTWCPMKLDIVADHAEVSKSMDRAWDAYHFFGSSFGAVVRSDGLPGPSCNKREQVGREMARQGRRQGLDEEDTTQESAMAVSDEEDEEGRKRALALKYGRVRIRVLGQNLQG
mmetsp:Transcript_5776/g.18487  ORF Transcript_5776/g.18487 Transcript_5776/m.18487 type:complete len:185 (-) Transcript_5776:53-607(-)